MEDVRWHYSEEPGVYAMTARYALLVCRRGQHRRTRRDPRGPRMVLRGD